VLISRVCRRTVSHMLCGVWVHLTLQLHMSYGGLLCRHRDEVCLVHVTLHPDRLIGPNQFHTCKLVLHAQAVLLTVGRLFYMGARATDTVQHQRSWLAWRSLCCWTPWAQRMSACPRWTHALFTHWHAWASATASRTAGKHDCHCCHALLRLLRSLYEEPGLVIPIQCVDSCHVL